MVDLLKGMTLKYTAHLLGVSWDTIKEIHTHHLECQYAPLSLEGVDSIGIDEFAVRKGHVYKTIVVDLRAVGFSMWVRARLRCFGRILEKGQTKEARPQVYRTDLSAAFISSVLENCPNAVQVFDHFHVVKLVNEMRSWTRYVGRNITWKKTSTSAKS